MYSTVALVTFFVVLFIEESLQITCYDSKGQPLCDKNKCSANLHCKGKCNLLYVVAGFIGIHPYSVRMWGQTDQKISEFGHFSRDVSHHSANVSTTDRTKDIAKPSSYIIKKSCILLISLTFSNHDCNNHI